MFAGTSKESFEAPTGKYVPKPKNKNVDVKNTDSLEQQYSSLNLEENTATGVYNSENMNRKRERRRHGGNFQQKQTNSISENTHLRRANSSKGNTNPAQRTLTNTNYLHKKQGKTNFKKHPQHNNNSFTPVPAADFVKQTVAMVVEAVQAVQQNNQQQQPCKQQNVDNSSVDLSKTSAQEAVSFFKRLFR